MVDIVSTMEETVSDLNQRIAERVRELRAAQALSLDALAKKCGVSRSMISLIERGESSPTAAVLEKLAAGLNVPLASLFDAPAATCQMPGGPVARRADQPKWRDPGSGYLRRSVSPPGMPQPMQIVEVQFPPGRRVAFEAGTRDVLIYQQVWVLKGTIDITVSAEPPLDAAGDCLAMQPTAGRCSTIRHENQAKRRRDRMRKPCEETMSYPSWSLRRMHALDDALIGQLADVLIDCVDGGASVSFMHPLSRDRAITFWRRVAQGVAAGDRALLVAEDPLGVCGTVQLVLDQPENQPHRADLAKMLVHRRARRQGLGAALLRAAEATARECGKTLLVLDAVTEGDGARLYERLGWQRVGEIPGYALFPQGGLCSTTFYYRNLVD